LAKVLLKLIYFEGCLNQKDATHREKYLKTHFGKMFLKNRLKSYLTGLIFLFAYLFILSFTLPVQAVSCTQANCNGVACGAFKDCLGSTTVSPYCSCVSCGDAWGECCSIYNPDCKSGASCQEIPYDPGFYYCVPAPTNTPIPPTRTPTPVPACGGSGFCNITKHPA
jgi:hypothetical protein